MKALAALTIVLVAAGCASGTKSGGTATHVIRIVMQTPDAPDADAEYFISQVKQRSRGRIEILEGSGYTSNNPSNESGLVRALRSGKVEMAYIPSRAWERASSVTAFRALQAPFLVTTYPLLRRITTGSIGRSMLRSLGSLGLVGLGLVPDELRRPLGRRPLDSPATLRGARIRVITSPTSVLALRSLGIVPVTSLTSRETGPALKSGRVDGAETSTNAITNNSYVSDARYLTANLAFYAKTQTIVIRRSVFERLSATARSILQAAAAATVAHGDPAKQERNEVLALCGGGLRLVRASPADLVALQREAAPVYPILERDPTTREEIRAIERLRAATGGAPPVLACPSNRGEGRAGSKQTVLAGTYAMAASQAEIHAFPGSVPNDNWGSFRLVLRRGRYRLSDSRPGGVSVVGPPSGFTAGTYAVDGDRITFTSKSSSGDTPLGSPADPPVICRWSVYRGTLTFRRLGTRAQLAATAKGLDPGGPPLLYVKPWQRAR